MLSMIHYVWQARKRSIFESVYFDVVLVFKKIQLHVYRSLNIYSDLILHQIRVAILVILYILLSLLYTFTFHQKNCQVFNLPGFLDLSSSILIKADCINNFPKNLLMTNIYLNIKTQSMLWSTLAMGQLHQHSPPPPVHVTSQIPKPTPMKGD